MPTSGAAPVLGRILIAVALYTLASWLLIGATIVAWAPGRSLAADAVSRAAGALSGASPSAAIVPIAMDGIIMNCADHDVSTYGFEDTSEDGFSWGLQDGDGDVWVDGGDWRSSQKSTKKGGPRFWFREDGTEYVVRDPAILAEVRAAVRAQLELENTERSGQQRELARRMSELSAKQQAAMKDVRQKIRELAARARREGKAERPHANA